MNAVTLATRKIPIANQNRALGESRSRLRSSRDGYFPRRSSELELGGFSIVALRNYEKHNKHKLSQLIVPLV